MNFIFILCSVICILLIYMKNICEFLNLVGSYDPCYDPPIHDLITSIRSCIGSRVWLPWPSLLDVIFVVWKRKLILICFFDCTFSSKLWIWLSNMLTLSYSLLGWSNIWRLLRTTGADHDIVICKVAIIFTLNSIWKVRNLVRFNDTLTSFSFSTSFIMAAVSVTGNAISVGPYLSLHDFEILKRLKVTIRPPRAPNIL